MHRCILCAGSTRATTSWLRWRRVATALLDFNHFLVNQLRSSMSLLRRLTDILAMYFPPVGRLLFECNYGQVCELDLIFNFHKAYYILDEVLLCGEQQETSKKIVLRVIAAQVWYFTYWDLVTPSRVIHPAFARIWSDWRMIFTLGLFMRIFRIWQVCACCALSCSTRHHQSYFCLQRCRRQGFRNIWRRTASFEIKVKRNLRILTELPGACRRKAAISRICWDGQQNLER